MTLVARAPGKLVLLGEYAVLEGAPALVTAVDRYAEVTLSESQGEDFCLDSSTLGISDLGFRVCHGGHIEFDRPLPANVRTELALFVKTFEYVYGRLLADNKLVPFRINLDTAAFYTKEPKQKLGLGSSAALTAALVVGLLSANSHVKSTTPGPSDLFHMTFEAHAEAQSNRGSGIDVAASVFGGVLEFQKPGDKENTLPQISPLEKPDDIFLIPVWTGTSTSTRQMLDRVHRLRSFRPREYRKTMDKMVGVSTNGCKAFAQRNSRGFLACADEYYRVMWELGEESGADIISEIHREIADVVRRTGAVYKPSGAGGGDIGLAFANSEEMAGMVAEKLSTAGFQILALAPSDVGAVAVQES